MVLCCGASLRTQSIEFLAFFETYTWTFHSLDTDHSWAQWVGSDVIKKWFGRDDAAAPFRRVTATQHCSNSRSLANSLWKLLEINRRKNVSLYCTCVTSHQQLPPNRNLKHILPTECSRRMQLLKVCDGAMRRCCLMENGDFKNNGGLRANVIHSRLSEGHLVNVSKRAHRCASLWQVCINPRPKGVPLDLTHSPQRCSVVVRTDSAGFKTTTTDCDLFYGQSPVTSLGESSAQQLVICQLHWGSCAPHQPQCHSVIVVTCRRLDSSAWPGSRPTSCTQSRTTKFGVSVHGLAMHKTTFDKKFEFLFSIWNCVYPSESRVLQQAANSGFKLQQRYVHRRRLEIVSAWRQQKAQIIFGLFVARKQQTV